jgi:ssDNA-binding Zn-finger/Zn-ribbon topoisomerase 1
MKVAASKKEDLCPKCGTSAMVMGMKTGNTHIYGCLKCRNAQGLHFKASDAKKAWKSYKDTFLKEKK